MRLSGVGHFSPSSPWPSPWRARPRACNQGRGTAGAIHDKTDTGQRLLTSSNLAVPPGASVFLRAPSLVKKCSPPARTRLLGIPCPRATTPAEGGKGTPHQAPQGQPRSSNGSGDVFAVCSLLQPGSDARVWHCFKRSRAGLVGGILYPHPRPPFSGWMKRARNRGKGSFSWGSPVGGAKKIPRRPS